MTENKDNSLHSILDSNLALFDLKLKAAQIKNNYNLKDTINSLSTFIDSGRLNFGSP